MTESQQRHQIGRLAMRVEGENWNAYYASRDTMEGAIPLGSIRMGAVRDNAKRKQAFMALMQDIVADFLKEHFGQAPAWTTQTAPEHERSGSA
jgi:hypothetical protein